MLVWPGIMREHAPSAVRRRREFEKRKKKKKSRTGRKDQYIGSPGSLTS